MSPNRSSLGESLTAADGPTFGALANSIAQFAWIADASGSIYWYNRRWYDYTGTTLDQMAGWGWQACHHPDHVARVVERISQSFESGEPWEDTFPLRGKDGSYRWFLSRAMPVRDAAGHITHWFGTNTDIEEQRNSEEALRANTEFLTRILESSNDCISVLDLDGTLRFMNNGGLVVMEIDDFDTVEGRNWLEFWKGEYAPDAHAALLAARAGRTGRFRGFARTAKGAPRWWDVRVTPINGANGQPMRLLSISRDITAEQEAEQSVRDMNQALEAHLARQSAQLEESVDALQIEVGERTAAQAQVRQMQKMEAVGLLTGGIAHDFNNKLAVIIGALNLVERRLAKGEDATEFLRGALDSADSAAKLTHQLLAFSRQLPLSPETLDANQMVKSMSEILQRTLGETTRLETVLTGGLWKAHADVGQLENAILNLAINARDAMPEGGRLTIETANTHLDETYARKNDEVRAGQYVMVAVSDTGTGMPPDILDKVFEPFFTTKGVGKGTGLGLSQVYGFLKQSKGHVKIYSEVGHGTTVKMYLPRLYGDVEMTTAVETQAHAPRGVLSDVVLVVEDDDQMRKVSAAALRELGYTVLHASSAVTALQILETHPQVTVLFTDIVMPDMNGRQLSDAALKIHPGLKVLFTTGYTRNAIVHHGVLDADVNFISKPFTVDQLALKMRQIID